MADQITRKIDSTLNALERNNMLTREGRAWLIAACDPFHDQDIAIAGYPDVLTAASVVQLVKQQVQITVPTSVASPNNWDCSIALFPQVTGNLVTIGTTIQPNGSFTGNGTTNTISVGGLSWGAGPSGAALWPIAGVGVPGTVQGGSLDAHGYVRGNGRLIGMGFELVNTTAELYKQGQLTAWRMPTTYTEQNLSWTTTPQQFTATVTRFPPGNIANAQLLFGSRSWAAAEGAYIVGRQNSTSNPPFLPSVKLLAYTSQDMQNNATDTYYSPFPLNAPQINSDYYPPFDTSGVHLTGLSYQTSLTVNVRWLFERIPSPLETDLVVLATPSSSYDALALELYTRCMQSMPAGVMLKENPLGEWFANILGGIADIAPKIGGVLGALGIPGAAPIGQIVSQASREIQGIHNENMKKKNKKKPLPPLPVLKGSASSTSFRGKT
jgi:hypothetical protein